jgi:hypothetical protein
VNDCAGIAVAEVGVEDLLQRGAVLLEHRFLPRVQRGQDGLVSGTGGEHRLHDQDERERTRYQNEVAHGNSLRAASAERAFGFTRTYQVSVL